MRKKSKRVIPGFGLSLGVTISILSIVVLIPLASLVIYTAKLSPAEFWETITRPRVLASFRVSLLTAFVASAINAVMGVILAWVLVRYRFPLKQLLNGMIELPFALPLPQIQALSENGSHALAFPSHTPEQALP